MRITLKNSLKHNHIKQLRMLDSPISEDINVKFIGLIPVPWITVEQPICTNISRKYAQNVTRKYTLPIHLSKITNLRFRFHK